MQVVILALSGKNHSLEHVCWAPGTTELFWPFLLFMSPALSLKPSMWPYDVALYYLVLFLQMEQNLSNSQEGHQQK